MARKTTPTQQLGSLSYALEPNLDLSEFTIKELKSFMKSKGLPLSYGKKEELINRLSEGDEQSDELAKFTVVELKQMFKERGLFLGYGNKQELLTRLQTEMDMEAMAVRTALTIAFGVLQKKAMVSDD